MKLVWTALVATACASDPRIEILTPVAGTIITDNQPLVMTVRGRDLESFALIEILIEGRLDSPVSSTFRGNCDGCTFDVTVDTTSITDGSHEIQIAMVEDLVDIAKDSVTVVFDRP